MKMLSARLFIGFFLFSVVVSGCSKPNELNSDPSYFTGDLTKGLDEIYDNPGDKNLSSFCDTLNKDQKYEVARALQQRKGDIDKYIEQQNTIAGDTQKMGSFEIKKVGSKATSTGWEQGDSFGWTNAIQYYQWIKDQGNMGHWAYLNERVRFLMPDEKKRIGRGRNYSIGHDDKDNLKSLLDTVTACANAGCDTLIVSDEIKAWAMNKDFYPGYFKDLENEKTTEKIALIQKFSRRLKNDYDRFEGWVSSVVEVKDNSLVVHIDPSLIDPAQSMFNALTAEVWSQFGIKVTIDWTIDNAATILLGPNGLRSGVDQDPDTKKVTISLPPVEGDKVITHEFGHVLGLPDQYYTLFTYENCAYHEEKDPTNVMSAHQSGSVQQQHIDMLKDLYKLQTVKAHTLDSQSPTPDKDLSVLK